MMMEDDKKIDLQIDLAGLAGILLAIGFMNWANYYAS